MKQRAIYVPCVKSNINYFCHVQPDAMMDECLSLLSILPSEIHLKVDTMYKEKNKFNLLVMKILYNT